MAGETLAVGFEQFVDVAFADAELRGDLGNRQNGIVQSVLDIFQDRRQKRRANGFFGDIGIERSRGHPGRQPDQAFQEEAAVSRIKRPGTTVQGAGGRADQRAQERMVRYSADAGRLAAGKRLFDQIARHPERSHAHVPFGRMENPEGLIAAEQGDLTGRKPDGATLLLDDAFGSDLQVEEEAPFGCPRPLARPRAARFG